MSDDEAPFFHVVNVHRTPGTLVSITRLDEDGEPLPDSWVALSQPVDLTTFTTMNLSGKL